MAHGVHLGMEVPANMMLLGVSFCASTLSRADRKFDCQF